MTFNLPKNIRIEDIDGKKHIFCSGEFSVEPYPTMPDGSGANYMWKIVGTEIIINNHEYRLIRKYLDAIELIDKFEKLTPSIIFPCQICEYNKAPLHWAFGVSCGHPEFANLSITINDKQAVNSYDNPPLEFPYDKYLECSGFKLIHKKKQES